MFVLVLVLTMALRMVRVMRGGVRAMRGVVRVMRGVVRVMRGVVRVMRVVRVMMRVTYICHLRKEYNYKCPLVGFYI